jgi:hypothetical protein
MVKTEVYSLPEYITLSTRMEYPEGYLMDPKYKGTGRLPRLGARKAVDCHFNPHLSMA